MEADKQGKKGDKGEGKQKRYDRVKEKNLMEDCRQKGEMKK